MSVHAAVERDLKEIRKTSKALAESALAESARVLAGLLDDPDNSATSKAQCARALTETMGKIRELLPPERSETKLDDIAKRRAARRRAAS